MSKLIHSVSLDAFKTAFEDWNSASSSVYRTVAFTDDGYLYTHGKVFKMSNVTEGEGDVGLTAFSRNGLTISITISGNSRNLGLPQLTTTTDEILGITNPATGLEGYSIAHKTSLDAEGTSLSTISGYVLTSYGVEYDKYGHITGIVTDSPTHIDYVNQTLDNSTATAQYLLFGSSSTTTTGASKFSTKISAIASSGTLRASVFEEGGTTLANKYAPKSLATTYATNSQYGLVLLSDSTTSSSGVSDHIAATPKAVMDALTSAKSYADGILATNDAMVFKGTLGTGGTETALPTSGYSAGWTYRVVTAGTYAGKVCEIGDLVIAVKDFNTSTSNDDWTVAQTNIDGAVTATTTLGANQLILGNGVKTVKALANGTNGQVLKLVNGVPTWEDSVNVFREIKVDGTSHLGTSVSTALNIVSGDGISLTRGSNGNLTISTTGLVSSDTIKKLNFNNNDTLVKSYNPIENEFTVRAVNGLTATAIDNITVTLGHSNSIAARTTAALGKISYDAYGHITGFTEVTSLKNPTALKITINAGATEGTSLYTYDGSVAKNLNIASGANVQFATVEGKLTIQATDTLYKIIAGASTSTANAEVASNPYIRLLTTTNTGGSTLRLLGSGATTVKSDASGNITITSSNTWRPVNAWKLSEMASVGDTIDTILPGTTNTDALSFSSTFAYSDSKMLDIVWAEVDENGTVTYQI